MTITTTRPHRRTSLLVATALGAALLLGSCSSGDSDSTSSGVTSDSDGGEAATQPDELAEAPGSVPEESSDEAAGAADVTNVTTQISQRAVISTGTVELRSEDVAQSRFDVQQVVDRYAGQVTDEQTGTDREGEVRRARLVLRVPAQKFTDAMGALEEVADLDSSSVTSDDVTTEVIDTDVRVRAQEKSLKRIETLLDRADSLDDVVSIERELTRRQSELDSLKSQQAYLADQTSLSTITVSVERTREPSTSSETDEAGFLSGLKNGWNAMVGFGTGAATVIGALLPFAVLFGLVGFPLWVATRRLRQRRTAGPTQSNGLAQPNG